MGKRFLAILLGILLLVTAAGCETAEEKTEEIRDLEYTVVKEEDIPEALKTQIEEKKTERFKLTYQDGEYLYIASGYGKQETGGYSIEMEELFLSSNSVHFSTQLLGPKKGERVVKEASYPYIVIKLETVEEPVVFE